jgi:hypothetical protein
MEHHMVSEVLLKQWSGSKGHKQLVGFDMATRRRRDTGPRGLCKISTDELRPADKDVFEAKWDSIERQCEPILKGINQRRGQQILDEASSACIRDLLSVHVARSFNYRERHKSRMHEALQSIKLSLVPMEFLTEFYRAQHGGLYPPYSQDRTLVESEWRSHLEVLFDQKSYSSDAMMQIFGPIRMEMERWPLAIVDVRDAESTLLIGDCPVLPLAVPDGLADEPFGPTVSAYFLPLGRHHAAFTVREPRPQLNETSVTYFNRLQIEHAMHTIVWSPDDECESFVNVTLAAS